MSTTLTPATRERVKARLIAGEDHHKILNEEMTELISGQTATDEELDTAWTLMSEIEDEIEEENEQGRECDPPIYRDRGGKWHPDVPNHE